MLDGPGSAAITDARRPMASRTKRTARARATSAKPAVARAELIDKPTRARVEAEIEQALKRRSTTEGKLAGVVRALAPHSAQLRSSLADAATTLAKRGHVDRELFATGVRALSEAGDRHASQLVRAVIERDDGGGFAALGAASRLTDAALAKPLAKHAAMGSAHVAFAAEVARLARGESQGGHLRSVAPMIKESHRIALCLELFLPLSRGVVLPDAIGPALAILRSAERHLGRWLVFGQVANLAGDKEPIAEASERATTGAASARAAWSLVRWALADGAAGSLPVRDEDKPSVRPTVELMARLSDRPSADRDMSFLFAMARAGLPTVRPMLESLVKGANLQSEIGIRAAMHLARDHGREELGTEIESIAASGKKDELRGLACAALWDVGRRDRARELAEELGVSRHLGNVAWAALVRAAMTRPHAVAPTGFLTGEAPFRWIQWGWIE